MQPNQQIVRTAWQLENQTAVLVAHALRHLQLEQSVVDGYGTGGDGSGRSSGDSSSTERAALLRESLTTSRESIKAEIEALIDRVSNLDGLLRKTLGNRVPTHLPTLCDGRKYEGWSDPWTPGSKDERNGWSKPDCREVAGPSGLCLTCRARAQRWRERNNLGDIAA